MKSFALCAIQSEKRLHMKNNRAVHIVQIKETTCSARDKTEVVEMASLDHQKAFLRIKDN